MLMIDNYLAFSTTLGKKITGISRKMFGAMGYRVLFLPEAREAGRGARTGAEGARR